MSTALGHFDLKSRPAGPARVEATSHRLLRVSPLAPDHVPPDWPHGTIPQQVHLDLHVEDPRAAHDEAIALGARLLQAAPDPGVDEGHQVYADPAGHPFCIGWGQPSHEQLAAFVARQLGSREPGQDG